MESEGFLVCSDRCPYEVDFARDLALGDDLMAEEV